MQSDAQVHLGKTTQTQKPQIAKFNWMIIESLWIIIRFWEIATYPSPKPTSKLTSHLGQNAGLGEG